MSLRTRIAAIAAASTVAVGLIGVAAPANAEPINVTLPLSGSTTLAKQGAKITLPAGGSIVGDFDLGDGATRPTLSNGKLSIPEFSTKLQIKQLGPLGPTTSKVKIVPTKPINATVTADNYIEATTAFRINLTDVRSDILPFFSIAKPTCVSGEIPITLKSTNKFSLTDTFNLEGTYNLPSFTKCGDGLFGGAIDGLLTTLLSGPGNTLSLKAGPLPL